jgi:DNA-directed RNA polymerase subunit K/omega
VPTVTRKPTRIAMEEVLSGAVTYQNAAEATKAAAPQ